MENWLPTDLWESRDAVFLVTGMAENERFVRELAREQQTRTPGFFSGPDPLVYNRMPYVAPYEKFDCLRRLASQIRDTAGLRAEFRGIVALDLSEWKGHEAELYLKVTFKYLHDHRQPWKVLVTAGDTSARELQPLVQTAAPYLRPDLRRIYLFRYPSLLQSYLDSRLDMEPDAAALLARVCIQTPTLHSCAVTGQMLDELGARSPRRVTVEALHRYLEDETCLPALLGASSLRLDAPALEEKEV